MRVELFFVPISDPTFPSHGPARLAGALKAAGHDCRTHDLNIDFMHHLLSPDTLTRIEAQLQATVAELEERGTREELSASDWEHYQAAAKSLLVSRPVIDNVEAAKAALQDREHFDDAHTYNWAHQVLVSAFRMASARYHPTSLSFHKWSSGTPLTLPEIERCVAPGVDEPFRDFFQTWLSGHPIDEGPVLFGISIMFLDQLVAALLLAEALKAARPDAQVVFGGAYITHLGDQAAQLLEAFESIDILVPGAGETPLLELAEGRIPKGIYRRGQPHPKLADVHRYDIRDRSIPYYEPRDLPKYLSPEPVLLMRGSRGCYWGRCVYCSHHIGEGRYAPRTADAAFDEMMELKQRHGARFFYLSDDAISPRFMRQLSKRLIEAEPDGVTVRWFGDARPEDLDEDTIALAARAGLVMLFLGIESASPKVRKLMQRGGEMDAVRACIDACHQNKVLLKLNFIFGFPGETEEDAEMSLAFIDEIRTPADTLGSCPFYLTQGSPLQLDQTGQQAGIGHQTKKSKLSHIDLRLVPNEADNLTLLYDFATSDGQDGQSVIDGWLQRYGEDPRLQTSTWRVFDISRNHRALMHELHTDEDFEVSKPAAYEPPAADGGGSEDPIIRTRRPVRVRTFQYNLAARGGASRITPMSFVGDELVRFPNPDGGVRLCGVPLAVGELLDGELREGLRWSEIQRRLMNVPDGSYAVQVLAQLGLVEVVGEPVAETG